MKEKCTLCGLETNDLTHLQLYVIGSEGINACISCRMILTNVAEGIKHTANHIRLSKVRDKKKQNKESTP